MKMVAPRDTIGYSLTKIGEQDEKLLVLDADLGRSTRLTTFEKRFPDRYLQFGAAEQNAIGFASGLVYAGWQPVFVTFTMFSIGLGWTQIRQAAYAGLPIKIIATHPGFDIGPDGGTHQMLEDIALARVIPEIEVLSPSDVVETDAAIKIGIESPNLTFIRVGRQPVPILHDPPVEFSIGKAEIIFNSGNDFVFIADGSMVFDAIEVAKRITSEGYPCRVVNVRTIKPLDEDLLANQIKNARYTITVENHSVFGGLGGAISELAANLGKPVFRIGSPDCFGHSANTQTLRQLYGLDADGIYKQLQRLFQSI
jgi:transketolase